ncbi:MAG: hypothetical protein ABSD57_13515 [Verrucomicrobiota bacterium]|jgi:hypothetical protein
MQKSKKLKIVALIGVVAFLFIFILLPILGHAWRKKHQVWHPPLAQASSWKRFTSGEGKFSVRFPGIPKSTNMPLNFSWSNVEVSVEERMFYVNPNIQNAFVVGYSDSPIFSKMAKLPDPQEFLKKSQSLLVSEAKGKVVFEQESKFEDYPAREFEYVAGGKANYSVRVKYMLVGPRVYQIYVVFLTANPYPEERAIFFNSFKIFTN